ncbi:MAG: DUF1328 domain-containing protein [Patescibacteria group bacterium]
MSGRVILCLVAVAVTAIFGFGGIVTALVGLMKFLFVVGVIVFLVLFCTDVMGVGKRNPPPPPPRPFSRPGDRR